MHSRYLLARKPGDESVFNLEDPSTEIRGQGGLETTGASLWIQHDFVANRGLRKSPASYD